MKVWEAPQGCPLQPLVVLAPATISPIKSLVVLSDQLLCCAHANGKVNLCVTNSRAHAVTARGNSQQALPTVTLQHAVYQIHWKGLSQCVRCEVGLMSVGSSGTILMWSISQIKSMLEQGGVYAEARSASPLRSLSCMHFLLLYSSDAACFTKGSRQHPASCSLCIHATGCYSSCQACENAIIQNTHTERRRDCTTTRVFLWLEHKLSPA